jgi:predicted Na+-dependent transporter
MLVLIGSFQVVAGLAAIINDDLFTISRDYAFDLSVTAWGWIHLTLGILMLITGFGLFAGRAWAGATALFLAMVSALANFFFIPHYPWWALLIIALDAWVIWALTRPGAVQT